MSKKKSTEKTFKFLLDIWIFSFAKKNIWDFSNICEHCGWCVNGDVKLETFTIPSFLWQRQLPIVLSWELFVLDINKTKFCTTGWSSKFRHIKPNQQFRAHIDLLPFKLAGSPCWLMPQAVRQNTIVNRFVSFP